VRTIISRLLLLSVLVVIQFLVVTGFDYNLSTVDINQNKIAQESTTQTIEKEDKKVEVVQTKPKETKETNIVATKETPKPKEIIIIDKKPEPTMTESENVAKVEPIKEDKKPTKEEIVKIDTPKPETQKAGKILTLAVSLIRSTPILDKTKANAIDYRPKGIVLEYEKELKNWYYLGNNQYIHKSVVKKLP
jgi:hypothetical protein